MLSERQQCRSTVVQKAVSGRGKVRGQNGYGSMKKQEETGKITASKRKGRRKYEATTRDFFADSGVFNSGNTFLSFQAMRPTRF